LSLGYHDADPQGGKRAQASEKKEGTLQFVFSGRDVDQGGERRKKVKEAHVWDENNMNITKGSNNVGMAMAAQCRS